MDRDEIVANLRRLGRRRRAQQTSLDRTETELQTAIAEALAAGLTVAEVSRFTGYHRNSVSTMRRL